MNTKATSFEIPTFQANLCLYNILQSNDFEISTSEWTNAQNIRNNLSRRHVYRVLKYFVTNKLINKTYFIYEDKTQKIVYFDCAQLSSHFNCIIKPYHSRSGRTWHQFMSERCRSEIIYYLNDSDHLPFIRNTIKRYLAFAMDNEFYPGSDRHFDITSDGRFTYTPRNKYTIVNSNNKWVSSCRQEIKYGKGLRKMLQPIIHIMPDQLFEDFHNYLHSKYNFTDNFSIVTGDEIKACYHENNYASNCKSLNNSCMKYDECQDYLDIYSQNPEQCSMLVTKNYRNLITGRALLWQTKYNDQPITLMDRIYGNDVTIQAFKDYAEQHGYGYKVHQTYNDPEFRLPNGSLHERFKVELSNWPSSDMFPYMDTFKYLNEDSMILRTYNEYSTHQLEETRGGATELCNLVTLHDGTRVDEDDAGWCEYEDQYYHSDDVVWSDIESTYIPCDIAIYVDNEDTYVHPENNQYITPADDTRHYHCDYLVYSEFCCEWYKNEYFECPIMGIVGDYLASTIIINDAGDCLTFCEDVSNEQIIDYLKTIHTVEEVNNIIALNPDKLPILNNHE